jgi:hypothetical protein
VDGIIDGLLLLGARERFARCADAGDRRGAPIAEGIDHVDCGGGSGTKSGGSSRCEGRKERTKEAEGT